jgi:hypothetical protein
MSTFNFQAAVGTRVEIIAKGNVRRGVIQPKSKAQAKSHNFILMDETLPSPIAPQYRYRSFTPRDIESVTVLS